MCYKEKYLKYKKKYLVLNGGTIDDSDIDKYVKTKRTVEIQQCDDINNLKVIYFDTNAGYSEQFITTFCDFHNELVIKHKIPESNIFGIFNFKDISSQYNGLDQQNKEKPNIVNTLANISQNNNITLHFKENDRAFDLSDQTILDRSDLIADSIYKCNPLFLNIFKNNSKNYILNNFDNSEFSDVVAEYNSKIVPNINENDNVILIIKSHGDEDEIQFKKNNMHISKILHLFFIKCDKLFYIPYYCRSIFTNQILKNDISQRRNIYTPRTIFLLCSLIKHPLIDDLQYLSNNSAALEGYFGKLMIEISHVRSDVNFLQDVLTIIDNYDPAILTAWLKSIDTDYILDVGAYNRIKDLSNTIIKLEHYFNLFKNILNDNTISKCFDILLKYYRKNVNPYEKLMYFSTLYDSSGDDVIVLLQYIDFIVNNFKSKDINNIFRIGINKTIDWIKTNNKLGGINPELWATTPFNNEEYGEIDILLKQQQQFILEK